MVKLVVYAVLKIMNKAVVGDGDVPVLSQKNICKLHVPMNDAVFVKELYCRYLS